MKKLIGVLAILAFAGNMASAELLKNFKYNGSLEVNAYQVRNADYDKEANDKINDTESRVMIGASFDLNEDAVANVTVAKCGRNYDGSTQQTVSNGTIDSFSFYEANVLLKGVLGFDHKVGKQYYGNAGDLVAYYGPLGWPYTVGLGYTGTPGIDGYTGWYKTGKWDLHGVFGEDTDTTGAAPDTDATLFGLVAKYDLNENMKLGGYYYRGINQAGAATGPNNQLDVLGVKVNGNFKGFDYNAELAKNMGRANDKVINNPNIVNNTTNGTFTGMGFLANVKYGLDLAGKLALMGEYAMGTGDDDATDDEDNAFHGVQSDYRPGIIWGGYKANAGIDNLTTFNVGAKWTPAKAEKLDLCAKYYTLAYTEEVGTAEKIGTELDFAATWNHSDKISVKAYLASFTPDKDIAPVNDDAETMIGANFNVKF